MITATILAVLTMAVLEFELTAGDELRIGDDILVVLLPMRYQHLQHLARLGIDAPPDVQIWREEILLRQGKNGKCLKK